MTTPLLRLEWRGVVLRRQPPFRVEVCRAPTEPAAEGCAFGPYACTGPAAPCPSCNRTACTYHAGWHRERLPVPPDAWRQTLHSVWAQAKRVADVPFAGVLFDPPGALRHRASVEIGAVTVSRVPPWRLWYCRTPSTGHVAAPCGHAARTCHGRPATCPRCGFSYCQHHHAGHARNLTLPEYVVAPILGEYRCQLDALALPGAPRRGIQVHAPPFKEV